MLTDLTRDAATDRMLKNVKSEQAGEMKREL
jgi:hypothetical protein